MGFSLQGNRNVKEGLSHPDRNGQFTFINDKTKEFQRRYQPVISVDTKKKELIGAFKNGGKEYCKKGTPEKVNVYDFIDQGFYIPEGDIKNPVLYPTVQLVYISCALSNFVTADHKSAYNFLLNHLIRSISKEIKRGIRAEDDWSIEQKLCCNCEYCDEMMQFLKSNSNQKIWSIVMDVRKHIIEQCRGMCLPIHIEVVKKGSPHKLVITKNQTIHQDARDYFKKMQNCHNELIKITDSTCS